MAEEKQDYLEGKKIKAFTFGCGQTARFAVIRVLFVKKIASKLTPIDTNIKRRVQI